MQYLPILQKKNFRAFKIVLNASTEHYEYYGNLDKPYN